MKFPKACLFIFLILLFNIGCRKEKSCSSLPEGLYEGWFTDNSGIAEFTILYLNKIDDNTYVINTTNDPKFGPYIKRNKCSIGGVIEGKSCVGEIKRKKGKHIFEGSYSYLYNGGGAGNTQFYEVQGSFEIKSN